MIKKDTWDLKDKDYGPLLSYIEDNNVTDINFNGSDLWIDDITKGRYKAEVEINDEFIQLFTMRIKNAISANFNQQDNVLEAETKDLRISIIHESATNTGTAISIRKTPPVQRMSMESVITQRYCSIEMLNFLENCIKAHLNVVVCGLTGTGKTELVKFMTKFIPDNERVITIEDNLEIRYSSINPGKDCIEFRVSEQMPYSKAIKTSLRQLPQWILLSESRSVEVKQLLEALSTGHNGLTTMHTDDVRKIPGRIKNMMQDSIAAESMENDIYEYINVGILIKKKFTLEGTIYRYIDQIGILDRVDNNNIVQMIVKDGKLIHSECELTPNIQARFQNSDIVNPFKREKKE